MSETINSLLPVVTVVSHAALVFGGLYFLFFRKQKKNSVLTFLGRNGMLFAFLVSVAATVLSLYYSEIVGFEPCVLCWYQRIAMYPQVVLLGLALLKKDTRVIDYALVIGYIGFAIAAYHVYIYYGGASLFPCDATGVSVECTKRYVYEFGYITIPSMSATSFLLLLACLGLKKWDMER